MKIYRFIFIVLFIVSHYKVNADIKERKHKFDFSLDIYSKHLWRGLSNGTAPSIQPSLEYSFNNFSAGTWLAVSTNGSYQELDLFASYTRGSFKVTLYDYFCPVSPLQKIDFFEIRKDKTKHTFDLNIEYAQPNKHALSILVATMIFGDDLNKDNGKNQYSTFIQPTYTFLLHRTNILAFAGFTPFISYYAQKPAFVNTGITIKRTFKVKEKYSLGTQLKFVYNPDKNLIWVALGINL